MNKTIISSNKKKRVGKHVIFMDKPIGVGSFSKVYRGIQQSTQQQVAIKIVDKTQIEEDQYTKNAFYGEIQIMKQLKSPNIIRFINIQQTQNNYYLITELAQGGTLRQFLKHKKFSQTDALKYMTQILNGIKQLVKFGIIHRDLKPENILLKDDTLKLADFGFAKQSDNGSFMKSIVGTPIYMSPQLLDQQQYSYKCDIWAMGVIFYQLVVGKIPWNIQYPKMIQNIKSSQLQFPKQLNIKPQLQDFIRNCLAYNENDRYDWESIFSHPLFIDYFKINFTGEKRNTLKMAFILADLRMSIHSKNINLAKLFSSLPQNLDADKFSQLISIMDQKLRPNDINQLFQQLKRQQKKKGDKIASSGFVDFLKTVGVRMQSLDLSQSQKKALQNQKMIDQSQQMQVQEKPQHKKRYLLFDRLKNKIQQRNIDIHELYRKQDINKKNALGLNQFASLILTIDHNLTQNEVIILFKEFDINNDQSISFSQYYSTLCKITGTVKNGRKLL